MTRRPDHRRLLIWDVHGTVADSFTAIQAAVDQALYAHGHPPPKVDVLRDLVGLSLPAMFARLVGVAGVDQPSIDALVATYRVAFGSAGRTYATAFPGVEALLKDLAERDVKSVAIAADSNAGLKALLEWLGVAGYFDMVVSDDDVACPRPHPDIVLTACQRWACAPGQALVISANAFGLEMGRHADAQTCGVAWGSQNHLQLIDQRPIWLVNFVDHLRSVVATELAE